ncbi:hypothetical protein RHRU231_590103 [Rhodococcus ruber]|uniref:Uncharacterized protein n=1 Tax=Rhodococcus ruber TaxID=1830 RepID=A0A098BMU3_9NOCA|nr:hypothetical protein RHRU231_590103 [Rhodococcus ruber]
MVEPDQEVRGVPPPPARAGVPQQCERLRHHIRHGRVEIQRHQMIPLHPRLEPDPPAQRRRPVPAGEVLLPPVRRERPHRTPDLRSDLWKRLPRQPPPVTGDRHELHLDPAITPGTRIVSELGSSQHRNIFATSGGNPPPIRHFSRESATSIGNRHLARRSARPPVLPSHPSRVGTLPEVSDTVPATESLPTWGFVEIAA